MNDSLLNGFLIFGAAQSILFASLFFTKKNRVLPDLIMAAMLYLLAFQIGFILLNYNFETTSFLHELPVILTLCYGPLLFLYVNKLTKKSSLFRKNDFLHFLPFVCMFAANNFFSNDNMLFMKVLSAAAIISGSVYIIFTYVHLENHKRKIVHEFSNIENINLAWAERLVAGLLFLWIGIIVLVSLHRFAEMYFTLEYFFLIVPAFVFYIGFYGFKQQVIYTPETKQIKDTYMPVELKKSARNESYKKSGLSKERMKFIFDRLLNAMEEDKLWLNETLSLKDLSEKLQISKHHITQTLNEYGKQNFYDFVNIFRVKEFKRRLETGKSENFTILSLAFDSGFNSKSSFNRIFKKFTGMSPSCYKNSLQKHL